MAGTSFLAEDLQPYAQRLVDEHFDHWRQGRPRRWEARLKEVLGWLDAQTQPYEQVGLALIAQIRPLLVEIQQGLPAHERRRFLFRVDADNLRKSPESILEKMAREWERVGFAEASAPPKSFHNLADIKDLGRFRIIASFLSDVTLLCERVEGAYDASQRRSWSPAQRLLAEGFRLVDNRFENLIAIRPPKRTSGERCRKGLFAPLDPTQAHYRIEVQVVTAFQEGWDKKDHHLIYERVRTGQRVDEHHRQMSFALSEHLYIADVLFDELKRSADEQSREQRVSSGRR